MEYIALKHSHMLLALVSVVLFYTRAFARIKQLKLAKNKLLFIGSHSIDTLLLISAVALAVMLGLSPHNQPWLLEKILLVVAYIVVGILMARQKNIKGQVSLLLLATTVIFAIFYLARFKTPFLF
ncbi:SirB2 family protein [Pseudoalteromonas piratica]|uniref:Transcriptional regulator n=1 Tax=Pseudoalteromonas piratica TaxID=1348114 RepID=A0A0A7EJX5_9GAMM|nr:SirB2 family protein [Pseudoalteromonas piratica]AIY66975.1 transcriptional regulator [Pseudoalteromonas piratica]